MISIVEQAGFQYKVAEGDVIDIPLLAGDAGQEITLDKVLLVGSGSDVKIGTPLVEGAEVKAEIIEHGKDKKIRTPITTIATTQKVIEIIKWINDKNYYLNGVCIFWLAF